MLRVADSAKMFPFSLAVCQILQLSNPGVINMQSHLIYLPSLTQTQPFAFFFFFSGSFRVSQPLTSNCWVSSKHCVSGIRYHILQEKGLTVTEMAVATYYDILLCHYLIFKFHFNFSHRFRYKPINFCGCLFLQVPPFWNTDGWNKHSQSS